MSPSFSDANRTYSETDVNTLIFSNCVKPFSASVAYDLITVGNDVGLLHPCVGEFTLQSPKLESPGTWWHEMEIFSVLPALCEGNPPVTCGFPSQRPVTQSFDVFFDLCLSKRLKTLNMFSTMSPSFSDANRTYSETDVNTLIFSNCVKPFSASVAYYIIITVGNDVGLLHPCVGEFTLQSPKLESPGTWWRDEMEIFSVLPALCEGNPPVTCGFPSQRPVTQSFDVFFDLCLSKWLSKQSRHLWLETPVCSFWRHCNVFNNVTLFLRC